jgi:hypothetical protein
MTRKKENILLVFVVLLIFVMMAILFYRKFFLGIDDGLVP